MTAVADSQTESAQAQTPAASTWDWPVPDSFGIDRYADDRSLRSLLPLYLERPMRASPPAGRIPSTVGSHAITVQVSSAKVR